MWNLKNSGKKRNHPKLQRRRFFLHPHPFYQCPSAVNYAGIVISQCRKLRTHFKKVAQEITPTHSRRKKTKNESNYFQRVPTCHAMKVFDLWHVIIAHHCEILSIISELIISRVLLVTLFPSLSLTLSIVQAH